MPKRINKTIPTGKERSKKEENMTRALNLEDRADKITANNRLKKYPEKKKKKKKKELQICIQHTIHTLDALIKQIYNQSTLPVEFPVKPSFVSSWKNPAAF